MYSKKDIVIIILSSLIGAIFLVLLSALQKYLIFIQITSNPKAYIIPIIFGGFTGGVISLFFIRLITLNKDIKRENRILGDRSDEIESLYNELEAHSQTIDELNHELHSILRKYVLLISSVQDINKFKDLSENEFILKVYSIAKEIIGKFDSAIVYTSKDGLLNYLKTYAYDKEVLNAFEMTTDFINKQYPETGIYYPNKSSITRLMTKERREVFDKINKQSKELIFLSIRNKDKKIGGIFFELAIDSQKYYTKNDLNIMKALQSIFENYYEGVKLQEIREKQLIHIV